MLISSNVTISTIHKTQQPQLNNTPDAAAPIAIEDTVKISKQAQQLSSSELDNQSFIDLNNQNDAERKMQYQDNLALFIHNAQRYSQHDNAAVLIENRAAITSYSLVENKVVPTNPSKKSED